MSNAFSSFFTYFPLTQWHHPGISKNDHWNLRISQAAKAAGEAWQLQHFKQTQHTQDPWRELGFLCAAGFKLAHPRGFEVYITAAACYICCWFNVTSYQGWICGRSEKSLIPAPEVQDPAHRTEDCQKFWISPAAHGTPFLRNLSWCLTLSPKINTSGHFQREFHVIFQTHWGVRISQQIPLCQPVIRPNPFPNWKHTLSKDDKDA